MDYKEALEYINKTEWFGSRPGLERITAVSYTHLTLPTTPYV